MRLVIRDSWVNDPAYGPGPMLAAKQKADDRRNPQASPFDLNQHAGELPS